MDLALVIARNLTSLRAVFDTVFGEGKPVAIADGRIISGVRRSLDDGMVPADEHGIVGYLRKKEKGDRIVATRDFSEASNVRGIQNLMRMHAMEINSRDVVAVRTSARQGELVLSSGIPRHSVQLIKQRMHITAIASPERR